MNGGWMTLRDLEYLLAVAQFEHFAKAAEACRVSQPALSTQIKKFEERLGVEIFERDNRNVKVTERGRVILLHAQKIVDESVLLIEKAKLITDPLSGTFRLGAIATIGPYLFPYLLGPLRKKYPDCKLLIEEGLTDDLLEKLKRGKIDVVIAADTFSDTKFIKIPLYFEPFLAAVPKGHHLESQKSLSSKNLDAREMVLLSDGHCLSDQVLGICPRGKGIRRDAVQTASLETLRHLVASGAGYTLMPQLAVSHDQKVNSLLSYIPFDKRVGRDVIMVIRASCSRDQDIKALRNLIETYMTGVVKSIEK
ncbi:LysR family transcriptional regulator [bacterium]|nr:LysR family transcriptional regulator [bacterium]